MNFLKYFLILIQIIVVILTNENEKDPMDIIAELEARLSNLHGNLNRYDKELEINKDEYKYDKNNEVFKGDL